jgi:ABC-2 type transport system ATP-binding protein
MLTGLARPDEGSIFLSGIDCIKDIKKAQHKIGIVPDESNLYDEMNGFYNLAFCASLYGIEKKEREKGQRSYWRFLALLILGKNLLKLIQK